MIDIACHTLMWVTRKALENTKCTDMDGAWRGMMRPSFEVALDEIASLGFKGFETFSGVAGEYAERPNVFREMLQRHNLRIASVYGGGILTNPDLSAREIEENVRYAQFLKEHGADRLVVGGGERTAVKPDEVARAFETLAKTVNEMGRRCREIGVKLCYHPHMGTRVQTRDEVAALMAMTDLRFVFLCPDVAHLVKGGADPIEVIADHYHRIGYIHFKDVERSAADPTGYGDFVELGEGAVNLRGVMEILRSRHYSGWITIEQDTTRRTPRESALISKAYMEMELGVTV